MFVSSTVSTSPGENSREMVRGREFRTSRIRIIAFELIVEDGQ